MKKIDLQCMPITVSGVTVLRVHALDMDSGIKAGWVVGTVELKESTAGAASIRQLYVRPSFRREGIGSELIEYCVDVAKAKHAESLSLMLDPRDAKEALPFYRHHGFVVVAQYGDGEVMLAKVLERRAA